MPQLIDRYVLGARVAPVVVVSLSLVLAISAWIPFSQWPLKLIGGSALLAIIGFVLAHLTRDAGKAIEGPLWASWDGAPSIRFLRHRDPTIPAGSKTMIRRRLADLAVVDHMPSEEEERTDPVKADATYRTCSDWLRRKAMELKAKAPFDVVHSENISYGFCRNILGIKRYGLAVVGAAALIALSAFFFGRQPFIEVAGIALLASYLMFGVSRSAVKRAADNYAHRLMDSIQAIEPLKPTRITKPRTSSSSKAGERSAV
jgi:hypothetical protein